MFKISDSGKRARIIFKQKNGRTFDKEFNLFRQGKLTKNFRKGLYKMVTLGFDVNIINKQLESNPRTRNLTFNLKKRTVINKNEVVKSNEDILKNRREAKTAKRLIKKLQDGTEKKVIFNLRKNNLSRLITEIKNNLRNNDKALLKIDDDTIFKLTKGNHDSLIELIFNKNYIIDNNIREQYGSDLEFINEIEASNPQNLEVFFAKNRQRDNGGYFKYTHNLNKDLSRYAIYNEKQFKNKNNFKINCFIKAFKQLDIDIKSESKFDKEGVLESLKLATKTRYVAAKDIKKLAESNDLNIIIRKLRENNSTRLIKYNKEGKTKFELCLLDNHYFIYDDKTEFTSYSINNYDKIKHIKDWNYIVNDSLKKDKSKTINSFTLVKLLLKNKDKLLNENILDENTIKTCYFDNVDNKTIKATINNKDYKLFVNNKKTPEVYNNVYYFDTETYKGEDNKNYPYIFCILNCDKKSDLKNVKSFKNSKKMLDFLYRDNKKKSSILLYAHNAKFDVSFILDSMTHHRTYLEKNNSLISYEGNYFDLKITVKCTYKIIPMPLRSFGKCFKLDQKKEVMPYKIYNKKNLDKRFISIEEASKIENFSKKEKKQFIDNIDKWNLRKDDKFDILKYSEKYCKYDCIVLKDGFEYFRKAMMFLTGLDCYQFCSISSIADQYLKDQGCYDGVYKIGGITRHFIQKCCVGGRTMTRDNKKFLVYKILADYDGVSLYPSAMHRMKGFLIGKPKLIKNLDYEVIKNYSGYFVEIKIKKVKKKYPFPLMSYKDEKTGVRNYTNDMVGKHIFVDKIQLEDLIEFQGVEFDIIQGYYFNEGHNDKIKKVIKFLFDERLKKKKEKNPIQVVYKLIMNSSYGKSIIKPEKENTKLKNSEEDFIKCIEYNYSIFKMGIKITDNLYIIKEDKSVEDHFNFPQVGCEILSTSKRIMNEVMCLAEDKDCTVYYTDTDSMHIEFDKVKVLEEEFKKKYNRKITGKDLGQFHVDFELEGAAKGAEIKSKKSIFLGKKSYTDYLESIDEDGNKIYGFHNRMKGCPKQTLSYEIKNNNFKDAFEFYKHLLEENKLNADLTCGGTKSKMKWCKNMKIEYIDNFSRTLYFPGDYEIVY